MSILLQAQPDAPDALVKHKPSERLASIDIMRGLTMTVMVFVNELSGVRGLPWWTYHVKAEVDAMTYVDMVFPFFLFIVGLSMPLAIASRLRRNPSFGSLLFHVITRTAALMIVGLILANAEAGDASRMIIRPPLWAIVALVGAALYLNEYAKSTRFATLFRCLRVLGIVLVVAMLAIYRHLPHPGLAARDGGWLDFSYPEILGLIGYTYFAVALLYTATRRSLWAPFAWFVGMMTLNALTAAKMINFPDHAPYYIWPLSNGAMAGIMFAGIATSMIFLGSHRWQALRQKMILGLCFGVFCLIAAWLLTPLGISKIRATPTWSLYSSGAAVLLFTALYWICDVKKRTQWAFFARPAGANTLTTYLLPDFWYYCIVAGGIHVFDRHFNFGWHGIAWCVTFTCMILILSGLLTRLGIRLRL